MIFVTREVDGGGLIKASSSASAKNISRRRNHLFCDFSLMALGFLAGFFGGGLVHSPEGDL